MGNKSSSKKAPKEAKETATTTTAAVISTTDGLTPTGRMPSTQEKKIAAHELDDSPPEKILDLLLIMDCTASMSSWIQHCKNTLIDVLDSSSEEDGSIVRVAFIGYRDFCSSEKDRYDIHDFTYDHESMKTYISGRKAMGGGDGPEDVCGALYHGLNLNWIEDSIKVTFFCADAPCHGDKYHDTSSDNYPLGNPAGLVLEKLVKEFSNREILLTCYKLTDQTEQMYEIMEKEYCEGGEEDGFEFIDIRGQVNSGFAISRDYEDADDCEDMALEGTYASSARSAPTMNKSVEDTYGEMTKTSLACQKSKMYSRKGW